MNNELVDFFENLIYMFFFVFLPVLIFILFICVACQGYRKTEAEIEYIKRKNHNLNIEIKESR